MPIGPYKDFAECLRKNQDKDDPEAYCGFLEKQTTSMTAMWIVADLTYDNDADAQEAERLAREGKIASVSIDYALKSYELDVRAVDEDGFPTDWLEIATEAEILGATQLPMPAFADAHVEFGAEGPLVYLAAEGVETSDRRLFTLGAFTWRDPAPFMFKDKTSEGHDEAVFVGNLSNFRRVDTLVAAGNPHLSGLTKPRVEDGKIVGHGAGWGTCHTAFQNACVTAPSSTYKHVADGVPIYRHPRGDIHAPLGLDLEAAAHWYEAHCERVGLAGVGEDQHGIWVSGDAALDNGDLFLSGDWRADDGNLELISFLVVDNPGFPTAMVASEIQTALTSAGIVTESDNVDSRLARLEAALFGDRPEDQANELAEAFALTDEEEIGLVESAFSI